MPTEQKARKSPAEDSQKSRNPDTKGLSKNTPSPTRRRMDEDNSLLEKFMLDAVKDIYWAEKHLTKALPKMKKASTSHELKDAFDSHLSVTEEHVSRLEQVFELLGKKAQAKKCEAMDGLVKEAESIIEETEDGTSTRDVALIMAAQKVEHYEIATYGGLIQLAKILGQSEAADIFAQTLTDEKEADHTLTSIAENNINMQAEEEGGGRASK